MKILLIIKETLLFWVINFPIRTSALDGVRWKLLAYAGVQCAPCHIHRPVDFSQYGKLHHIRIGARCFINNNLRINVCEQSHVTIGNDCTIGPNVSLETVSHELIWNEKTARDIIIEDTCWIAANAVIIGGVTIGKGSVVAAGAVVTKNVAPYTLVGGVPAKEIKKIENV